MSEKFAISKSLRRGVAERRSVGQALNFGEESVGHLKEVFRVPCSQRKPQELVLFLNPRLNLAAPTVTL